MQSQTICLELETAFFALKGMADTKLLVATIAGWFLKAPEGQAVPCVPQVS